MYRAKSYSDNDIKQTDIRQPAHWHIEPCVSINISIGQFKCRAKSRTLTKLKPHLDEHFHSLFLSSEKYVGIITFIFLK